MLNPKFIASIKVITDPTTDTVPFIPHAHGIIMWYPLSISFIPKGKNLPRTRPNGVSSNMEMIILGINMRPMYLSKIGDSKYK